MEKGEISFCFFEEEKGKGEGGKNFLGERRKCYVVFHRQKFPFNFKTYPLARFEIQTKKYI